MNRPFILSFLFATASFTALAETVPAPDIIVAADGSGSFKTIQAAVESIPATNRERIVILVKDGVYKEKIRLDASFVTLRGQSRSGTRIEFAQLNEEFGANPDRLGRAVLNLNRANDFVLENLTMENTAGQIGPHAFTIYGTGDRTVIVNCDVLSHGADTVSLWLGQSGRYYHANCRFQGSVDFVCPRGWCYITNCSFYEMKNTAAVWHDGHVDKDMKFVMRDCKFDGTNGWNLARHHADAQFYFLDCTFSKTMIDRAPFRVIYPIGSAPATEADIRRNQELDKSNLWGERSYFYRCHRDGGDYAWHADNLSSAPGVPQPAQITAAWTFAGKWDPERKSGPAIRSVEFGANEVRVVFSENVTVKGKPRLGLRGGGYANYSSGSGTGVLIFTTSSSASDAVSLDLNGGAIVSCEAAARLPTAELNLPAK